MRGDPEAHLLCKGFDNQSIGPCGSIDPVDHGKLRDIETIMRDFVALDERARFLTQRSREDHWAREFIKNNFKAGAAQQFPNQATFGIVLDEMCALAKERTRGHQLTLSVL